MPSRSSSSSSLTADFKHPIFSMLPANAKVIATASARVYHTPFGSQPDSWTFSGLRGLLVFGRDPATSSSDKKLGRGSGAASHHSYWFRLLDVDNAKGLLWMHDIPDRFEYRLDKPFFHEFAGKTRFFGFRFEEDAEANKFYRKVISRIPTTVAAPARKAQKTPEPPKRLLPSMISSPAAGSFTHVSHVGFNKQGELEISDGLEPGWAMMLHELRGRAVGEVVLQKDKNFVDGFWAGVKATSPAEQKMMPVGDHRSENSPKTIRRKPTVNLI